MITNRKTYKWYA